MRNRIELVRMTPCTGDSQSEESTREDIDTIVESLGPGLGLAVGVATVGLVGRADGEEPAAGPRLGFVRHQLPGHLMAHDLVVGQVPVEAVDDPVAVPPRMRQCGVVQVTTEALAVAGHIQPVTAPAFAVVG